MLFQSTIYYTGSLFSEEQEYSYGNVVWFQHFQFVFCVFYYFPLPMFFTLFTYNILCPHSCF